LNNMRTTTTTWLPMHAYTSSCQHPYLPTFPNLLTRKKGSSISITADTRSTAIALLQPSHSDPTKPRAHPQTEVHRYKTRSPPQREGGGENESLRKGVRSRAERGISTRARPQDRERFTARQSWLVSWRRCRGQGYGSRQRLKAPGLNAYYRPILLNHEFKVPFGTTRGAPLICLH
jgi:hypothetical protein